MSGPGEYVADRTEGITRVEDLPHAVERGYRRHRKMPKTVDRVRTKPHISSRVALDMQREQRRQQRQRTTQTLHAARTRKAA